MKRASGSSLTTQFIILFGVFFLLVNIVLGVALHWQSSSMVQSLIRKNMLSISNTAAELIDGDEIGAFTEKDVGSQAYNKILKDLSTFQNNVDIEFIYAVRQVGPEKFVFTVDPDPVDPGQFGEEVILTDAIKKAGKGTAAVDDEPAADRWGNFYSSYSPIFDSEGKVAGIIGVDFSSAWYDEQVWRNTLYVIIISVLFTLAGAAAFVLLSIRVRRRFDELGRELSMLSDDVEELTQEIFSSSSYQEFQEEIRPQADATKENCTGTKGELSDGDEIRALGRKIRSMHREMEQYLEYMHAQANTDGLTGIGNTTAYLERQKEIEAKILNNTAAFFAIMFDINDLKRNNDQFGHAGGDKIIRSAASIIAKAFGKENVYRIGGDEFIVVVEEMSAEEIEVRIDRVEEMTANYNSSKPEHDASLSLSQGRAVFVPGQDHSFRDVFVRADAQMYEKKDQYHHRDSSERDGRRDLPENHN